MRIGTKTNGPIVLQEEGEQGNRRVRHPTISGRTLGCENWEQFVGKNSGCGPDFHGIFVRSDASSVSKTTVSRWPDGTMFWPDISNSAFYIGDHNSGQSLVPDTLLVVQLRSWPWTVVTGTVNPEARGGFRPEVGVLARHLQKTLRTDVIAVSNSGTLRLVNNQPEEFVRFRQDSCGDEQGVSSEWLQECGVFVPPLLVDSVDGWLRIRIAAIPRVEIVRIDFIRNLSVS